MTDNLTAYTVSVNMDAKRNRLIERFLNEVASDDSVGQSAVLLLEFWKFLDECEVERQRQ